MAGQLHTEHGNWNLRLLATHHRIPTFQIYSITPVGGSLDRGRVLEINIREATTTDHIRMSENVPFTPPRPITAQAPNAPPRVHTHKLKNKKK